MNDSDTKVLSKVAMFRSIRDMQGYRIYATDGEIGDLGDFLFDDEKWVLRHFVVDMNGREVLLSPIAFAGANWDARIMNVNLTLEQIQNSPDIDTDLPISRKMETEYYDFYGWPYYWGGVYTSAGGIYPYQAGVMGAVALEPEDKLPEQKEFTDDEIHLRSADEVIGYHVEAMDGGIGKVVDFIINDADFGVQFVVIDTEPLWFGGKVLLPTDRINSVSWPGRIITLNAARDEVKAAPNWDHAKPVCREYADCIQQHYKK